MRNFSIIITGLVLVFLISCENQSNQKTEQTAEKKEYIPQKYEPGIVTNITLTDSLREVFNLRGNQISRKTQQALKTELQQAIKSGGTAYAVSFCNTRAMEITDSVGVAEKASIRRIAKKYRNPKNRMDENESNLYKGYVINWLGGMPPYSTVSWEDDGTPIYYYPIQVGSLCLNCHGTVGEQVTQEVADVIAELYPADSAMDFKLKDPRGLWAISFPDYRVIAVD